MGQNCPLIIVSCIIDENMDLKKNIQTYVQFILSSALKRNTEQGKLVCEETLRKLHSSKTKQVLFETLCKFNKAFLGIEAHGYLTDEEYKIIKELREVERQLKDKLGS